MSDLEPLPDGYHSRRQTMVEPDPPREGYASSTAMVGYRSDVILKGAFPNSPIMWSDDSDILLTDKSQTEAYRDDLLESGVTAAGYEFPGGVDFNYSESPNMSDVAGGLLGGDGKPVGGKTDADAPWPVPTTVNSLGAPTAVGSYGIGATPAYQLEYDGPTIKQKSINFGAGPSSPVNPSESSEDTASQDFTALILGKSSLLRIGSYKPSDDTGGS